MSEFLKEYLQWGLSDIYVISHEEREEAGGYSNEFTDEIVVARKNDVYVKVELSHKKDFSPRGKTRTRKVSETVIPKAEYEREANGRSRIDTKAAREQEQESQERINKMFELEQQTRRTCT